MKTGNFGGATNNRRIAALDRLTNQIMLGLKQPTGTVLAMEKVALTEEDKTRIRKEMSVLQSRITSDEVAVSRRTKIYRGGVGYRGGR